MKKRGWREIKFNKIKIKHKKLLVFWNIFFKKLYIPIPKKNILTTVQSLSHVWLFATPWTAACSAHHQLPKLAQIHVHRVSDDIQPSHPLPSPSPPAFNLSQYQGLFQWGSSSKLQNIGVSASASVLPVNVQDWFPLGLTGLISLQSKGLSIVSNTTVQKHQFFNSYLSL